VVVVCGGDGGLDVVDDDEDIFRFEVGMNDATTAMHVIEAEEDLLCDLTDEADGDAFVLMPPDQRQQIFAEDLKDHADMYAVRAPMPEVVQKRDHV